MKKWVPLLICFTPVLWIWGAEILLNRSTTIVTGTVTDGAEPVAEARVRVQGSSEFVLTNETGHFTLPVDMDSGRFVKITSGKEGWYNAGASLIVGDTAAITMEELPSGDSFFYEFKSASECFACHSTLLSQWQQSKHAVAATNPMLLQIYNGIDVDGNTGIAPGFKLDYPNQGGDCADCHAPAAALLNPGNMDLNDVHLIGGPPMQGVFCDFCHKVQTVEVNYNTGVNGSIFLQRPPPGAQRDINIGPFDDVTTPWMGGTYSEVYTKSAFCSSCHQYKNKNDVLVDDTYDSWAASSYAANGTQCQDCHMKPWADSIFVGGIGIADAVKRDPARIYNHLFTGASSPEFQARAAAMAVESEMADDTLFVRAMVTNKGAGHNIPNGVSFRNILLTVSAQNNNVPLIQTSGDTIPHFGGVGDLAEGNYSGTPGKGFALVTRDGKNGEWPVPNWLATEIFYDSRISPQHTDTTEYKFLLSGSNDVSVSVKLLYRGVYKPWADVKGWDLRENMMADTTFSLPLTVISEPRQLPTQFALDQNYPNPFNPTTNIGFAISDFGFVELKIYDISGRLVKTLVKENRGAGVYAVQWDATNDFGQRVASGIYLYKLQATDFVQVKKMILLK